jgi:hypothetical protein
MDVAMELRRLVWVLVLVLSTSVSDAPFQVARAQSSTPRDGGWRPTQSEIMLLPQYCWAQFTSFKGPEYRIPLGCGTSMNHYCPGLVEFNRAKRSFGDPKQRLSHLHRARRHTIYSMRSLEQFPACPIRSEVEMTLRVIEIQWKGAGGK